jgi:hypothetical protein
VYPPNLQTKAEFPATFATAADDNSLEDNRILAQADFCFGMFDTFVAIG